MVLISLNVFWIEVSAILNFVSICFIDGVCVVALTLAVMTMSGSNVQPLLVMLLISGWYFWIFIFIVSCENVLLQ